MIEVDGLTKRYGKHAVVSGLSFRVGRGEVVGFLGPNGAGKSTTMRILSGFIPASQGTVLIGGLNLSDHSREIRKKIGYMPENNPLHNDMRVRRYLKFRARVKGLSRGQSRDRVDAVMQQCGLTDVSDRIIGQLSKGFKQRVGLADTLVHEPELIILDEPTIGLDPHQIRSVRELIQELGKDHTVLLSSHILPEVEMTCNRVLILHQGKIRAADETERIQQLISNNGGPVEAQILGPKKEVENQLSEMKDVESVNMISTEGRYQRCLITPNREVDLRLKVFDTVTENGWKLRELKLNRVSLEDLFVRITKTGRGEEDFEV